MLFSNEKIAGLINQSFEPVWESVRSVPTVHIDFGAGHVLTRTLHGNIATYVCNAEGYTLDIIPGIYEAKTYLEKMRELQKLWRWTENQNQDAGDRLNRYHEAHLQAHRQQKRLPILLGLDVSKSRIEGASKLVLLPTGGSAPYSPSKPPNSKASSSLVEELAADTLINESARRAMIHQMFLERGMVKPANVTKWLYREVLHADIDDPYLGLRDALFTNYPFADDDQTENAKIGE